MNTTKDLSIVFKEHYAQTFSQYGETSRGVDWGDKDADHIMRLDHMLAVARADQKNFTLLDVGSGFGSLLDRAQALHFPVRYTGIDLVEDMVASGRRRHPEATWIRGDVLTHKFDTRYDYVVNNGVFTQKLDASIPEMQTFTKRMIKRMFALCRQGIAFNLMTTHVNFMVSNLYYTSPIEVLAWCMSEVSSNVRVDHAYPLYEYTVYLYRHQNNEGGSTNDGALA